MGTVEAIPQSNFAKPSDIDTAIFNLIGGAPGALNTLDELAQALADDANFAATVTNLLAAKVSKTGDETIAGKKTFTGKMSNGGSISDFSNSTVGMGVGTANQDATFSLHCSGTGLGIFGFDFSDGRFVIGSNAGKPIDFCTNVGGAPSADNLAAATPVFQIVGTTLRIFNLPTSPSGQLAGTVWRSGNALYVA